MWERAVLPDFVLRAVTRVNKTFKAVDRFKGEDYVRIRPNVI